MGSIFRSEEMVLCQIFIQPEAAYTSVAELGEIGVVQFRDLNTHINAFNRKFVQEIRRCDEMERKLRYIEKEINKDEIILPEPKSNIPRAPNPREFIDLEANLERTENEILELSENGIKLKSNFLEMIELLQVLENTENFFSDQEVLNLDSMRMSISSNDQATQGRGQLSYVAGVIEKERVFAFETMLWRISHGNVLLRSADLNERLKDPKTGDPIYKTVFIAFFQGEQLKNHIKRVCTGFHASLYPCPSSHNERVEMVKGVLTRLEDLKMILNQTQDHRRRVLVSVAKELTNWTVMVRKMKAIYHTLNLFNMDVIKKCLIGECWVPANDLGMVQKALLESSVLADSAIPPFINIISTNEAPPTFYRTNRFTKGFQSLIDAYGISTYREVNPALYTIITFPFLFGIMFGDVGHGIIMTLIGASVVAFEKRLIAKKINNELWNIFFGGRYIILLMGIFSIYTGAIYNDIFSKSFNIFGSKWTITFNGTWVQNNKHLFLDPKTDTMDSVYPFGIDPVWQVAENKIIFLNSYKMKLSIIFGVVHMIFGVCLSVVNHVHFRKGINIVLEFLPQLIFLLLIFGYMVFMMFFKWAFYTAKADETYLKPGCAPSILILFINMILFKHYEPLDGCKEYFFDFQNILQMILVAISFACIPWLLLAKPIYIMRKRKQQPHWSDDDDDDNNENEEEPISEVFINQAIHTVEYILSTISHTASYLRLWALSLAHAQLSEVLWGQVFGRIFRLPIGFFAFPVIFHAFYIWAFFTLTILVTMEGLSAFLHTLRLHWVEFMSKFYDGVGYPFHPFSFKAILENQRGEDDE